MRSSTATFGSCCCAAILLTPGGLLWPEGPGKGLGTTVSFIPLLADVRAALARRRDRGPAGRPA